MYSAPTNAPTNHPQNDEMMCGHLKAQKVKKLILCGFHGVLKPIESQG